MATITVNVRNVRRFVETVTGYDATVGLMHEGPATRWWFIGASGSGKSTYARAVARVLGVSHIELDSIYHQANWTALSAPEFRRRVHDEVARDAWTVDGNYRAVRAEIMQRVQLIVALDLPKWRVMSQITRRTLWRSLRRAELWNGNRESMRNVFRWDPQLSVIRWSWTTHAKVRERFAWFETLANEYGVRVIRVRSHKEAREQIAAALGVAVHEFLG
jgi:adenylate kinase family enzyme